MVQIIIHSQIIIVLYLVLYFIYFFFLITVISSEIIATEDIGISFFHQMISTKYPNESGDQMGRGERRVQRKRRGERGAGSGARSERGAASGARGERGAASGARGERGAASGARGDGSTRQDRRVTIEMCCERVRAMRWGDTNGKER